MARNSRKAMEEAREAGEEIKEAVQERAGNIAQSVQKMGTDASAAVKEQYETIRDTASEYYDQGRKRARQLGEQVETTVQERPLIALLAAIGAGFLIGFFCRRT
jgi:ElaB/YqjD/DUF883 family membrane-anchored ribosome-binding protein